MVDESGDEADDFQRMIEELRQAAEKEGKEPRQPMGFSLTDEEILLVGKIVLNWSYVEFIIGGVTLTVLGNADEEYRKLLIAADYSRKISILSSMLKSGRLPSACKESIDALQHSEKYREARNVLSHGGNVISPDGRVVMTHKDQILRADDLPLALAQSQYALTAALQLPNVSRGFPPPSPLPRRPNMLPDRSGLGSRPDNNPPNSARPRQPRPFRA